MGTQRQALSDTSENVRAMTVAADSTAQYLTFELNGEIYGVEILRVHEIKGWQPVTHVPNAPAHVLGVLNLRGAIVPIIDMRARFNLEREAPTKTTVVIVVTVYREERRKIMGIVVDGVSDVLTVKPEAIKPPPQFDVAVDSECIAGLVAAEDQMVMLIDIDLLLAGKTTSIVQ